MKSGWEKNATSVIVIILLACAVLLCHKQPQTVDQVSAIPSAQSVHPPRCIVSSLSPVSGADSSGAVSIPGEPDDFSRKCPVVDETVRTLGDGSRLSITLHKTNGRFPFIRREYKTTSDENGEETRVLWSEVCADHLILTASGMAERDRVAADLVRNGWTLGDKSVMRPWMVVNIPGRTLAELEAARAALVRFLPQTIQVADDVVVRPSVIPNDSSYSSLWGMPKIEADRAWDIADGSGEVIIGIIDTGVDYRHPDLAPNIWSNPLEIPGNGIDDDGNGKVDDICGWNFYAGTTNVDNNGQAHGTHVAGIAAAVGFNSLGVIGAAPRARIIACRVADDDGMSSGSKMEAALEYLAGLRQRGIHVVAANTSMGGTVNGYSWGGTGVGDQTACQNGIVSAHSAGNASVNEPTNPYRDPWAPYILNVANSTSGDSRYSSSNVGFSWCDLAAPGSSILSTVPGTGYSSMTGTSMSSPHVAGVAALVASVNPSLSAVQIMHVITNTTDKVAFFSGLVTSGGRLNAFKAVQTARTYPHVTLLAPAQGGTLVVSQAVSLVASLQITSNTATVVRFYRGGSTLIGTDNNAAGGWSCNWTPDAVGTYDLTCEADDNAGHTTRTWWRTRVTVDSAAPATPAVTIRAVDDFAAEPADHAKLVVQLSSASDSALTVPLSISGTATAGADYVSLPSSVVVPAGDLSVEVPVAVTNDFIEEPMETVVVSVLGGAGYDVGASSNATVWIHDDETEAAPVIVGEPVDVVAEVGEVASFSIVSEGKQPLSYQWRKDSVAIPGATVNHFDIPEVMPGDVGGYSCYVTNRYGSAMSTTATLSLKPLSTMPASGFTPSSAVLNALLNASNATVNLFACWNTVNGGTNLEQWTNSAYVGTWSNVNSSNVSFTASGLQVDTLYYFTFYYTNGAGRIWSSRALTFRTMGAVGVDNNGGVLNNIPGMVQLSGELIAGGSADVRYYWGPSDGGTNPAAWANVVTQGGVLQGACAANLSNLLYGLTYYYRCHASNSLGTAWAPASVSFTTRYGSFSEDFDGVVAPALPPGWMTIGTSNWINQVATNDSAPNAAYIPDYKVVTTNSLISPAFGYVSGMGPLSFRHSYVFEGSTTPYDGGVLEIKIGDSSWQDIISAGGSWGSGGYNKTLKSGTLNPLTGRNAWGDKSGGFITTTVNLPASASGKEVRFRWMIGTDNSTAAAGWYVDTIGFSAPVAGLHVTPTSVTTITNTSATLNGTLACSGSVIAVYAHWGTVNGGTNIGIWANSACIGTWTNTVSAGLSLPVSGLNSGTTYYYTLRAVNACTNFWATNVLSFTTTGVPPILPGWSLSNQMATGVTSNSAVLNAVLACTGVECNVYAFWGTADGGTNANLWGYSAYVGTWTNTTGVTNLSYPVAELSEGTRYYFTFQGENSDTNAWATNVLSFITPVTPTMPAVDNAGATNATVGGCTLRGTLTTGGVANVWICWGSHDAGSGGTGGWENVISLGSVNQGDAFSAVVGGLSNNATYWYRCYASNPVGTAWSGTATSFAGLLPQPSFGSGTSLMITITNFAGRGVLTNFPLLVKLTPGNTADYGGFRGTSGYELRFWTNADLTGQELNYEIESFSTTSNSSIWVKVPALSKNCSLWASWGDPAKTNQQAYTTNGAVWTEGFRGVWHMNQTNALDSTSNRLDAVSVLNTGTLGLVGEAQSFNGSNSFMRVLDAVDPTAYTISAWIRPAVTTSGTIIRRTDSGEAGSYSHQLNLNGSSKAIHYLFDGGSKTVTGTTTLSAASWYYLSGTAVNSGSMRLYLNGAEEGTPVSMGALWTGGDRWTIGKSNPDWFNGLIDEVRISSVVRSTNWIWACWMNLANPDAFMGYGSVVAGSADPVVNVAPSAITNTAATLNATVYAPGTNYGVYAYWGTVDGGTNAGAWNHNSYVGAWTNIASAAVGYPVQGLVAGTTYYCTFQVTNSAGTAWAAPSWRFTTLPGQSVVEMPADTNADGIADAWVTQYFPVEIGAGVATNDADGDGLSNYLEYIAGTDPTNRLDQFVVSVIISNGVPGVTFTARATTTNWYGPLVRHYSVECVTNLMSTNWSVVPGFADLAAGGQTVMFSSNVADRLFFRARAWVE